MNVNDENGVPVRARANNAMANGARTNGPRRSTRVRKPSAAAIAALETQVKLNAAKKARVEKALKKAEEKAKTNAAMNDLSALFGQQAALNPTVDPVHILEVLVEHMPAGEPMPQGGKKSSRKASRKQSSRKQSSRKQSSRKQSSRR